MSERLLLALTVVATCVATPLAGQSTAQLEARARRLEAKQQLLKDSAALGEERLFQGQPRRYFAVAGITLGYPVEVADAAEQALDEVEGVWRARYGNALALLANDTITFVIKPHADTDGPYAKILWRFAGQQGERQVMADEVADGRWFTWFPRDLLQKWETSLLGPPMVGWLKANAPYLDAWDGRFTRRELLLSYSSPARRCLEGSLEDCERALALREGVDPFTEWYDRADLAAMARDARHLQGPGVAACRATGELDACRAALGGRDGSLLVATSTAVRGSLYLYALVQGGPDALIRLHAERDRPPAEQLAAAAGMPIDSLLARWNAAVVLPRSAQGPRETLLLFAAATFWLVTLLALFAWRFRWHHV
jgi:hypothetical protein